MTRKTWQPYDAQGRRKPPPYAPREPSAYQVLEDGTLYDWDHPDLDYPDRQLEGELSLNEDAVVRAFVGGVQPCDLAKACGLPQSIVGPIVTAKWFHAVAGDRMAMNFDRYRALISTASPDAVRYLYETMAGACGHATCGQAGQKGQCSHMEGAPTRGERMEAARELLRHAPMAESQGVIARRVQAIQRELQQADSGSLVGLSAEAQEAELVRKYLPREDA